MQQTLKKEDTSRYIFGLLLGLAFVLVIVALVLSITTEKTLADLVTIPGLSSVGMARLETTLWAIGTVIFILAGSLIVAISMQWIAKKLGASGSEQNKMFWGFLFASPWIIGFFIFVVGPALASLYYSFTDYKLGETRQWIGFDNYRQFLAGEGAHGRRFYQAMLNSFYYAIVGVPLQIAAALIMALLLNQALKAIRLFRLIFYMPVILAGGPAILLAWRYMLQNNGGFVNEFCHRLADKLFFFDWLYRLFIYLTEGFNGFFIGLTRSNPIGPLRYTLPALLGTLVLLTLAFGDWETGKRRRAQQAAEVIGIIALAALLTKGLVPVPINVSWIYVIGLFAIGALVINARADKPGMVRALQYSMLLVMVIFTSMVVYQIYATTNLSQSQGVRYILAIALVVAVLLFSWQGAWDRRKYAGLGIAAVILAGILFIRTAPGQLDGGRLLVLARYATLQSALEEPNNQDYLETGYSAEGLSPLWIYGTLVIVLVAAILLHNRHPRARRYLLYSALAVFALLMVGSLVDGIRYFNAFGAVATAAGEQNYHFARFHASISAFPDRTRVPLWMTNELWSKSSLILITMWSSGAGMLIFLAALKGVPKVFYEAAEVDGASRFQKFFKITLPMISPAMFYNVVIGMIAALQTFEAVYILRTPENTDSLSSAAYYLYERTFRQLAIGQGSAMSWILVAVIVTLTVIQFRYSRWVYYEA